MPRRTTDLRSRSLKTALTVWLCWANPAAAEVSLTYLLDNLKDANGTPGLTRTIAETGLNPASVSLGRWERPIGNPPAPAGYAVSPEWTSTFVSTANFGSRVVAGPQNVSIRNFSGGTFSGIFARQAGTDSVSFRLSNLFTDLVRGEVRLPASDDLVQSTWAFTIALDGVPVFQDAGGVRLNYLVGDSGEFEELAPQRLPAGNCASSALGADSYFQCAWDPYEGIVDLSGISVGAPFELTYSWTTEVLLSDFQNGGESGSAFFFDPLTFDEGGTSGGGGFDLAGLSFIGDPTQSTDLILADGFEAPGQQKRASFEAVREEFNQYPERFFDLGPLIMRIDSGVSYRRCADGQFDWSRLACSDR